MTSTESRPTGEPALAPGDSAAYLLRLGVPAPAGPTSEALAELQRAHLTHVPFENLDIALGRPIRLDQHALVHKVLREGRTPKLVAAVEQITFNGKLAAAAGRPVLYVTERCILRLDLWKGCNVVGSN